MTRQSGLWIETEEKGTWIHGQYISPLSKLGGEKHIIAKNQVLGHDSRGGLNDVNHDPVAWRECRVMIGLRRSRRFTFADPKNMRLPTHRRLSAVEGRLEIENIIALRNCCVVAIPLPSNHA
jgi:hypothetical protein